MSRKPTPPPSPTDQPAAPTTPGGPELWPAPAMIFPDEDPAHWAALSASLRQTLAPHGFLEDEFVRRLTSLIWRLRRFQRTAAGLQALGLAHPIRARHTRSISQQLVGDALPPATNPPSGGLLEAQSWLQSAQHQPDAWITLQRAQAALERSLRSTLATLTACQSRR